MRDDRSLPIIAFGAVALLSSAIGLWLICISQELFCFMLESLACGVAFLIVLMVVNFGNDCVYFIFAYGGNGSFNLFRFGDSAEVFSSS